jgi:catechol 2,3-dioxygenase-like lactoylglutathione lyase family enzyme
MSMRLTHINQWVHDQDEALAFYTEKLGMELREDATLPELGGFRWLTVGPAEQPEVAVALLKVPGPPVFDEETTAKLNDIVAKGAAGGLFFATDDIQAAYEQLKTRGVDIVQEPTEQPYGVDMAVRDPSGNQIRVAHRTDQ